ncbi:MAG: hypothetical protein JSS32_00860 [Verrucomicrobia bacterium]|nr:hypothetical protein [Verrucomicrobiota bacterium]
MVRRNPLHPYAAKAAREISSSSSQDEAYFLIAQAKLTLGDYEGVFKASNRIYSSVSTKQIASNVVERIQNLNGRSFSQEGPLVELALEHTHDLYSKMEVLKALKEKYVSLNNFSAASRIDEKLQNVRQRIQNGENLVLGIAGIVAGAVIASPLIIATTAIALPVMAAVAVPVVATGAIVTAAVLPIAAVVGAVAIPTIVLTGAIAAAVIPPVAMLATAGIVGYAALSILF